MVKVWCYYLWIGIVILYYISNWFIRLPITWWNTEAAKAVVQRCSVKKLFLETSQNSQENTRARVSLFKKRFWHSCFPVKFVKFLRTRFFTEHLWWLLLKQLSTAALLNTSFEKVNAWSCHCAKERTLYVF